MKNLFILLICCLSLNKSFAQSITKDFVVADSIYRLVFTKTNTVEIKVKKIESSDTAFLIQVLNPNNGGIIDSTLFRITVTTLLFKINRDTIKKKGELDSLLHQIYRSIVTSINYNEIDYGVNYYEGLTDNEKLELQQSIVLMSEKQKLKFQLNKQAKYHYEKKGFQFLKSKISIKIDSIRTVYNNSLDSNSNKSIKTIIKLNEEIDSLGAEVKILLRKRDYHVSFIGNANAVTSFKIANQSQLGASIGVLAAKPGSVEFMGLLTISQSNDTISTIMGHTNFDFGQSILIPGVRRFSLLTTYRSMQMFPNSYNNFCSKIGFMWNTNITPYNWQKSAITIGTNTTNIINAKVVPISMDFMFPFHWVQIYKPGKEIFIATDIGLTARYIAGDVNAATLKEFLGIDKHFYAGITGGFSMRYNGLRLQFHIPIIFGERVEGLTHGQPVGSISFVASIFEDVANLLKGK